MSSSRKPLLFCFAIAITLAAPISLRAVDFNRDVRPILSNKCFACHGPDEHERKADLRLDTREGAFADLGGYFALVPGKPEESEAFWRITAEDESELMPPPDIHKPLTDAEIATIREWIESGADYEVHWAYQPLEEPEIPSLADPFVRNPVDAFLLAAMREQGLEPSPEADRITLARRLHLDLTGLPPDPDTVQAFQADDSPQAYENLVSSLLDSRHYGERMAVFWLDLVRYADTIGYHSDNPREVSAYRDYVIRAFNRNLPFDQFTIEQLAGDLLPNPTTGQLVASGYNLLLQTTQEGGAQAKEYRAIYAADRVRNVSGVWLGSTMGCAQCHDHKYDPFSMKDFYSMAAFFADLDERAVGRRQPNLRLPTPQERAAIAELTARIEENAIPRLLTEDAALAERVEREGAAWEREMRARLESGHGQWKIVRPSSAKSSGRASLDPQPDGSVLSTGRNPARDNYTVELPAQGTVSAIRLEALTHPSFPQQSLARGNGNFVLTGFRVLHEGKPVPIREARADFEQDGYPVVQALDGDANTGWAGNGHREAKNRTAVFLLADPLELAPGDTLTVELRHRSAHHRHNIGRFRLSVSAAAKPPLVAGLDLPLAVRKALEPDPTKRTVDHRRVLSNHYHTVSPALAPARENLANWKRERERIESGVRTTQVSRSLETPRQTRVLPRGNWQDDSGEVVDPAVPAFLPSDFVEGRADRLDLAHWIVADTNPLTARAFANRIWKLFFGQGLSRDLQDLGGQGSPPTHPELLDYLAANFRANGWDVKQLVHQIITSSAYRQSSTPSAKLREADPGNQYFTRQGRWRLDAEFVRDAALQISGLLEPEIGGRSVKPYQPDGYWQHLNFPKRKWQKDRGDKLYRRGLYTFWCRTFLHPAMLAFDAPSREECAAERPRSNIPQQALVLLNDPSFVEASRVFAESVAALPADPQERIAVDLVTGEDVRVARTDHDLLAVVEEEGEFPAVDEARLLVALYESQLQRYRASPEATELLLSVGEHPIEEELPPAELAAWTQVARAILNAYETTSRF